MSSPSKETEEPTSTNEVVSNGASSGGEAGTADEEPRPPAKRRMSSAVIEISDTESDDSDICAVTSYQASADEVKRIRGADYSSPPSSSSSEYSSDSESPWEDDSLLVMSPAPAQSKPLSAHLNPRADRTADPKLNNSLQSQELIDRISEHWKEQKDCSTNQLTLTCEPFRLCLLHNLLSDPDVINNIVDDMNTLDWSRKKMDLYEFHQTTDLASLTWQRGIKGIYELLRTEVMTWVSKATGLELTSISASCSLYGPGDHLLVHDDLLADRRVAFVLYLAPWRPRAASYRLAAPDALANGDGARVHRVDQAEQEAHGWAEHMGGALELLARDRDGRPSDVVHRVFPRNNMLAFFQVGVNSFHQVGEVLSLELPRLSINGWFHGPAAGAPAPAPPPPPPPPDELQPHNGVVVLSQWVSAAYMSPRVRAQVQAQMERDSELCLRAFLPRERRRSVLAALAEPGVPWEAAGPADRGRYARVPAAWAAALPDGHELKALLRLLGSAAFCRLLADCTDLALVSYRGLEVQRWRAGDFTLLPPRAQYRRPRLEAVLYLGVPAHAICGGATAFVAPEDAPEEAPGDADAGRALVTLPPADNALNLVYCDAGVASFTKYVSKITLRPDQHFFVVTCSYME